MKKAKLILQPMGGLANRMRAVSVCYEWAKESGVEYVVEWPNTWDLRACWSDLFEMPNDFKVYEIGDGNKYVHSFQYKRWFRNIPNSLWAWWHNYYWIPYNAINEIKEENADTEIARIHDMFLKLLKSGKSVYVVTGEFLGEYSNLSMFRPIPSISSQISHFFSSMLSDKAPMNNIYGLHIRRTDNKWSIEGSPIALFEEKISKIISKDPEARFYIASDDQETITYLKNQFSGIVFVRPKTFGRNSVAGIQDAIIDMWILSQTTRIFGSKGSSYSKMAAKLGGIECEILHV